MPLPLTSPFYSAEANSIICHLTDDERRRFIRRGIFYGLVLGLCCTVSLVLIAGIVFDAVINQDPLHEQWRLASAVRPLLFTVSILMSLFALSGYLCYRKRRIFLAGTHWARGNGFELKALPLFSPRAGSLMAGIMCASMLLVVVGVVWPYVPGTLYFDHSGFTHGTGWLTSNYPSGKIKSEEFYFDGLIKSARWYKPDGTLLAETTFGNRGVSYELRDDGTIRAVVQCRRSEGPEGYFYVYDGPAHYYREDGNLERVDIYQDGARVKTEKPGM